VDTHGYVASDVAFFCSEAAMQEIHEKMDLINLDEDTIDAEVLNFLGIMIEYEVHSWHFESVCPLWDHHWGTHHHLGQYWWFGESQTGAAGTVQYPVDHLEKFIKYGMSLSKGVLFYSPPGTGKTLLGKATANKCNANFISKHLWLLQQRSCCHSLWHVLQQVVLDCKSHWGGGDSGGAGNCVLNQILTEMDSMNSKNSFIDLLSASFLAYSGFFDQYYHKVMQQEWSNHLAEASITFKPKLSLMEYLSMADDCLSWQSKSLHTDNLTTENVIMLKQYNHYPLIIDPTGQATTFLLNEYKVCKITITSFLDEAFLKVLESALWFSNPLWIQDAKHLDPILNAIVNKEIWCTEGCVLIHLGTKDIDFLPLFTMFLLTRDPSVEFSPDICSQITFVNFTMMRSSLQSQSLDQVLKVEWLDTECKTTNLMKAQGKFWLWLCTLEKLLLQALNESSSNILDDDKVIDTLETLKQEATEITRKVEETDVIMKEWNRWLLRTFHLLKPVALCSSFWNSSILSIISINSPCSSWTFFTTFFTITQI
jgi:hypothetical protein